MNGRTCLFDIVHSALWGSEYPVCTPDTQVLFLCGACMLHTQHSAVQAHPGGVQTVVAPFLLSAPSSSTQILFPSREKIHHARVSNQGPLGPKSGALTTIRAVLILIIIKSVM
jgi:hypothetical protein